MSRNGLILMSLIAIAAAALFAYREDAGMTSTTDASVAVNATNEDVAELSRVEPFDAAEVTESAGAATTQIAKWIADTRSDDADTRAAAISALADAPKAQALPVLQPLLSANLGGDRQRAADALHALALKQGDADGAIRDVLRLTIYDGDDEALAGSAQLLLDDIDNAVALGAAP